MDDAKEDTFMDETSIKPDSCENAEAGTEIIDKAEETAEDLMTDMKLDDETDYVREMVPDKSWLYHFEIFPWSADDMTESLIKIIKLASFSHLALKRKHAIESDEQERMDDKIRNRQRKGCLHLYVDTWQTAKTIMRNATWKAMNAKELTFEITRQCTGSDQKETAYIVADTYLLSKIRFRDKSKGEFKDRSAKISNIPGTISREFLDVVFSRAYVAYDSSASDISRNKEKNLQLKLQQMDNFNGSFDVDCLSKVSCRSLVLAYKSVFICGQKITLTANNEQTMVAPSTPHNIGEKVKKNNTDKKSPSHIQQSVPTPSRGQSRGRASTRILAHASTSSAGPFERGIQKEAATPLFRPRGMGRAPMQSLRPASAPFPRAGPGMPVPMTGRQKMNEKLRRQNPGPAGGSPFMMSGATGAPRATGMGSVGDSFKHEIASLQNQLERNTQALEAQIARLKQESTYFSEDIGDYDESPWNDNTFDYENEEVDYMYDDFGRQQEEFRPMHNRVQRYQAGFPQGPPGFHGMKGPRHSGISNMSVPSASPRMDMMQSGARSSEVRRGGRGRNMTPAKSVMGRSHDSVFW